MIRVSPLEKINFMVLSLGIYFTNYEFKNSDFSNLQFVPVFGSEIRIAIFRKIRSELKNSDFVILIAFGTCLGHIWGIFGAYLAKLRLNLRGFGQQPEGHNRRLPLHHQPALWQRPPGAACHGADSGRARGDHDRCKPKMLSRFDRWLKENQA